MDARLNFEWSSEKARALVLALGKDGFLQGNEDIVDRDDADYEISLTVKLKHKRKARAKKEVVVTQTLKP